jgi:thiol:disulfide interchange protein DsbD
VFVARAILEKGWYIFSQNTPDGGPIPTSFRFNRNPMIEMTSVVKEVGKMENRYDKLFGVDVRRYSEEVSFVQVVSVKGKVKTNVSGSIEYMLYNEKETLPPMTNRFIVELK